MDSQLNSIIEKSWYLYVKYRGKDNAFIVKPSIPILWFGNYSKYKNSHKKVVTLAINPSNDEFKLNKDDPYSFIRFKRGAEIYFKNSLSNEDKLIYVETLNKYFEDEPYNSWFRRLETPLNYINSTYGGKTGDYRYSNYALHIDLCPLATQEKWGKINNSIKDSLIEDFQPLLNDLIEYLNPSIIMASISSSSLKSLFNIRSKEDAVVSFENQSNGFVRKYKYNDIYIYNGRNMRGTPFGAMTNEFIQDSLRKMEVY
ncbi:hypothetical protein [Heliorestis convoluta]|uniref:Uncharacterized protein n=1 Tax=Heliorestis convoluta TaxID=356322 RepID=A0A5Q2N2C6_9FIRM|nr:hypothetical protein [Heliorestis convoluta]QGG48013.1 hypothetical protein FTV88_1915 [Heliorestis convoluta]